MPLLTPSTAAGPGAAARMALPPDVVVAVIGAGAMGAGIAQVAASAGHPVRLYDTRPQAAANAIAGIRANLARLVDKGKLDAAAATAAGERLSPVDQLAELAGSGLAIEAIVEDLAAKRTLFAELETHLGPQAILATNTSSISITAIGAALARPERLAGLHFFNPAPLMALVEVVSGLASDPAVLDTLEATSLAWGKTPVRATSTPGFIVNRVARPYYGEALRLLAEGAADAATLDAIYREAGGFRMGPFELMDLIGLDVNYAVTCSVWNAYYNDPRYQPSLIQHELVAAGRLGRKSGRGFHDYRPEAPPPAPAAEAPTPIPPHVVICGEHPAANALRTRLTARGIRFASRPAAADGRIAEVFVALAGTTSAPGTAAPSDPQEQQFGGERAVIHITDGRTATRRAAESGIANTVLIDLALDYAAAPRIAIASAEQCSAAASDAATGLLQAAGLTVSRLSDTPGLALMRSVAMLANEAAEAVYTGVCTAAAADLAMRLGTNYPRGPLAWAEQIGLPAIRTVLAHLADTYGEDRYRASPLLQRLVHSGGRFHA